MPLPDLPAVDPESGIRFAASMCLVRLHRTPLGLVRLELPPDGLPADRLAERIADELAEEVARHLRADGLPLDEVAADGIAGTSDPPCQARRKEFLSRAPFVSIVICSRDRPTFVPGTLRSIVGCAYPAERYEVIVVDNASGADAPVSLDEAELQQSVRIRLLREPEPGLAHARNKGLAEAEGEIVVYADDDVEVDRDWLATLVGAFERGERVGAASGTTLPGALDTPVQRWIEGFGGRPIEIDTQVYDIQAPPPDQPLFPFRPGELGAGRNMAFRRDLLTRLGGFDPALGPPGPLAVDTSDSDALLRVLLSERQVVRAPGAIVWHAHPQEYAELERRVWGYGAALTACLTKAVIERPRLFPDLLRKLPRGLAFALSPRSEKNVGRQADFPPPLRRLELRGMAYGPIAYLRSRRRQRRRPAAPGADGEAAEAPSSLRVLIVSDEYAPVVGGAARSIELLSRYVSRLGHTVAVATAWQPNAPAFEVDGDVVIHRIRDLTSRMPWISADPYRHHAPPFPDPEAVVRLRRLIRVFQPDLVHAYGWLTNSAATALLGTRIPMLISAHDYGNVCAVFTLVRNGKPCSGPAPVKCLRCAGSTYGVAKGSVAVASVFGARPLLRRKTTAIHSVSRYVAAVMDRDLRIPNAVSAIVPNFLQDEAGQPADEAILASLPQQPFILFVGHLRQYKGIHDLFAAYAHLDDPPPLVLVGTRGPDTPERFPAGVTVLTYVPHATVMAMWERALFAVSPSIAAETGPIVVQEAMSKGRAVIGTRIGGYEDLIDDGETGLLVPPGDWPALAEAMSRLIADEALRERIGRKARERAALFAANAIVPRLERLYYDTIEAAGQARV